jgi:hypothetical protein
MPLVRVYKQGGGPPPPPPQNPTVNAYTGTTSVAENAGTFTVSASISAIAPQDVLVDWATANQSALSGTDYTAASGTLTIPAGQTQSGTAAVTIADRADYQGDRTLKINFSNARLADTTAITIDSTAVSTTVTIVDNETPVNPVRAQIGIVGTGWFTRSIELEQGEVASGSGIQIGGLTTQTDIKNVWGDNSIKRAVVTANIPIAGQYTVKAGAVSGAAFTPTAPVVVTTLVIDGATWTAELGAYSASDKWLSGDLVVEWRKVITPQAVIGGASHASLQVIYDVRSYNDGTHRLDWCLQNVKDVAGAEVAAGDLTITVAGTPVLTLTSAAGTGTLTTNGVIVTFSTSQTIESDQPIRLTSGAQAGQVRRFKTGFTGTVTTNAQGLEWAFSANQTSATSWEKPGFTCFNQTRLRRLFNIGSPSFITLYQPDWANTYRATGSLEEFRSGGINSDTDYLINGSTSLADQAFFGLGRFGNLERNQKATAERPEIGWVPEWDARYIIHGTQDHYDRMMANATQSGGCWSSHVAASDGVTMIDPNDYQSPRYCLFASVGGASVTGPVCGKESGRWKGTTWTLEYGTSHLPRMNYLSYLLTGDRWHHDEIRFYAHHAMFAQGTTRGTGVAIYSNTDHRVNLFVTTTRGIAWGLRAIIDGYWCIADSYTTEKAYLLQKATNNLTWADSHAQNITTAITIEGDNTKKVWEPNSTCGGAMEWVLPYHDLQGTVAFPRGERTEFNMTNMGFQMYVWHHAKRLGLTPVDNYLNRLARIFLKLMNSDPTYKRTHGGKKSVAMGPAYDVNNYLTAPQVWYSLADSWTQTNTYADNSEIAVTSNAVPQIFYPFNKYYGPQMRMGLLIAEKNALSGATAALDYLEPFLSGSGATDTFNGDQRFCLKRPLP